RHEPHERHDRGGEGGADQGCHGAVDESPATAHGGERRRRGLLQLRARRRSIGRRHRRAHPFAPENAARRETIHRASMLTAKVMMKRARPMAMSALTPIAFASGNCEAM